MKIEQRRKKYRGEKIYSNLSEIKIQKIKERLKIRNWLK